MWWLVRVYDRTIAVYSYELLPDALLRVKALKAKHKNLFPYITLSKTWRP